MRQVEGVTLYTILDAAKVLGVTPQTIRLYIKGGRIPAKRIGRPYLICGDALRRFVTDTDSEGYFRKPYITEVEKKGEEGSSNHD